MTMDDERAAKKSLGQHWLSDPAILSAIASAAAIDSKDTVLEIGPGLGSLTAILLGQADQVIAVEYDQSLLEGLNRRFKGCNNFNLVNQDIRQFDLTSLDPGYKVVANIPYYLTSYLIRLISRSVNPPQLAVLLIQQEVAQRLAAPPGQLSLLGVMAQTYWEVKLELVVYPQSFSPPPKVNSQLVKLTRRSTALVPDELAAEFFRIVRIGFSQKRKTLLNSLSAGLQQSKQITAQQLEAATLQPTIRPQALSIYQWGELTRSIYQKEK